MTNFEKFRLTTKGGQCVELCGDHKLDRAEAAPRRSHCDSGWHPLKPPKKTYRSGLSISNKLGLRKFKEKKTIPTSDLSRYPRQQMRHWRRIQFPLSKSILPTSEKNNYKIIVLYPGY